MERSPRSRTLQQEKKTTNIPSFTFSVLALISSPALHYVTFPALELGHVEVDGEKSRVSGVALRLQQHALRVAGAQCNGRLCLWVRVSPVITSHFWLVLTPRALPNLFHQVNRDRERGHHWTRQLLHRVRPAHALRKLALPVDKPPPLHTGKVDGSW